MEAISCLSWMHQWRRIDKPVMYIRQSWSCMADGQLPLIRQDHFLTESAHAASQDRGPKRPSIAARHKATNPLATE